MMTHDYKRDGTATLFAALNVADGTVISVCDDRCRPWNGSNPRVVDQVTPAGKVLQAMELIEPLLLDLRAVFLRSADTVGLDAAQLHGDDSQEFAPCVNFYAAINYEPWVLMSQSRQRPAKRRGTFLH